MSDDHSMVPFSVLDLSPITEGSDAGQALHNSLDLARHVEALGYRRYWMAASRSITSLAPLRPSGRGQALSSISTAAAPRRA